MFTTTQEIPAARIADLLCGAFEGGSNYWYMIESVTEGAIPAKYLYENALREGGALLISADEHINPDREDGYWLLDAAALREGLQTFAETCPHQYAEFLDETDDSEAADCFLQCCLFGEVVFG